MADLREDQLPNANEPGNGARLRVVDALAATPTSANGPTVVADISVGRLTIGGHELGNTGQRAVTPLNGWTVAELRLSRTGGIVTLTVRNLNGAAATDSEWFNLPDGFKAITVDAVLGPFADWDQPGERQCYVSDNRALRLTDTNGVWLTQAARSYGTLTFPTSDAWPTSLPGTAV